jgi:DNA modification methylase
MIHVGDARTILPTLAAESVQCCVTSPPYWGLRDYGMAGQIGLESAPAEYVEAIVGVFREVRRVLREDGTLWLNLGDSYAGSRCGLQGQSGEMADRSVAAQRCRERRPGNLDWNGSASDREGAPAVPGLPAKNLVGIPWRVAFALQVDGWWLRSDIIWHKPNPMPESVTDRPTKAHEYVFLLCKSERYFYDAGAIAEPIAPATETDLRRFAPKHRNYEAAAAAFGEGTPASRRNAGNAFGEGSTRNARTVWTIATHPYTGAHFATFPPELATRCVIAGSRVGDTVLDPFAGAGTTCMVADAHQRKFIGIELNPEYATLARSRVEREGAPLFAETDYQ